jgi:endopolyphosphatase
MEWIRDNLKDSVDFVIWTGDSARHDNDEHIPRTEKELIQSNKMMAKKLLDVFSDSSKSGKAHAQAKLRVPIIPTIGNNDIMPHNIFEGGPNRWTRTLDEIWDPFIPEEQRHSFAEGGWFYVEVIPNKLAVFSLNTMYLFKSNSAVDGCRYKSEPGYEHMEWLRVQLQMLRDRNMKAILTGHVPPARTKDKRNWYESCWQKYALWMRQYRDVVVGSMYGHMNVDHFVVQDFGDVRIENDQLPPNVDDGDDIDSEEHLSIQSKLDYISSLRDLWSKLPAPPPGYTPPSLNENGDQNVERKKSKKKEYLEAIGGPFAEKYSLSFVPPSMIPLYYPTLRVVEYNISGLEGSKTWAQQTSESDEDDLQLDGPVEVLDSADTVTGEDANPSKKKGKKKKKKKKTRFKTPKPPPAGSTPGPAYSNQPLSWLSYTQYFANLTEINSKFEALRSRSSGSTHSTGFRQFMLNKRSGVFDDQRQLFQFEVEYDTRKDSVYKMKDMTVNSYLDLARRISGVTSRGADLDESSLAEEPTSSGEIPLPRNVSLSEEQTESDPQADGPDITMFRGNKVWRTFVRRAFVGFQDP